MTQEEKARAYDEALEKARKLCAYPTTKSFISDLQGLFPELKESEDERIVKELLTFFRESIHGGHILTNKEYDSWIAWLEKQGKQGKDILEDAILDGNEDGLIAETIRYKNEKQGEQKPAWSEEDEKMLQGIWDEILANKHDAKEYEWKTYDKFLNWLKSLTPQNRWKPSDEQIRCLKEVTLHRSLWGLPDPTLNELLSDLYKLKEE